MAQKSQHKGRVTVQRIAEEAGLTIGSVSSVLNNKHIERRISPATVAKVRETAARLGYLPNINARQLRGGSEFLNTVTLAVITSFEAPLTLVNHIIRVLRELISEESGDDIRYNFTVTIEMFPAGDLKSVPGLLTGSHFNAAIITNTNEEDDRFLLRNQLPYPTVLINRSIPGYACVLENPETGARAADLLIDAGCSKLAILHGLPVTQVIDLRTASFMRRVSSRLGSPVAEIVADKLTEHAAMEAMQQFLESGQSLDGLYAMSDGMAIGAYHAIKQAKLTIPDDVAVIGAGDYNFSSLLDPPLSVVGSLQGQRGIEAVRLLLKTIREGRSSTEKIIVPFESCLRESIPQVKRPLSASHA